MSGVRSFIRVGALFLLCHGLAVASPRRIAEAQDPAARVTQLNRDALAAIDKREFEKAREILKKGARALRDVGARASPGRGAHPHSHGRGDHRRVQKPRARREAVCPGAGHRANDRDDPGAGDARDQRSVRRGEGEQERRRAVGGLVGWRRGRSPAPAATLAAGASAVVVVRRLHLPHRQRGQQELHPRDGQRRRGAASFARSCSPIVRRGPPSSSGREMDPVVRAPTAPTSRARDHRIVGRLLHRGRGRRRTAGRQSRHGSAADGDSARRRGAPERARARVRGVEAERERRQHHHPGRGRRGYDTPALVRQRSGGAASATSDWHWRDQRRPAGLGIVASASPVDLSPEVGYHRSPPTC